MGKSIVDIKQTEKALDINTALLNRLASVIELPENIVSLNIKIEVGKRPIIEAKFIGTELPKAPI